MKNETINSEPLCIQRARALVELFNQTAAELVARRTARERAQLDAMLDDKTLDPELAAQRAGEAAREEVLLRLADRNHAATQTRGNELAAEIVDLLVPIERKLNETNRANIETARHYVTRKLAPWFNESDLPAAVGRAKIFLTEAQFASDHGQAPSYYVEESTDAKGTRILSCRSLQGLLRVYEKAQESLAAVEAHAAEFARSLK
jgi:hypothetical protein